MGRGTSTDDELAVSRRATSLMSVGDAKDASKHGQYVVDKLFDARQALFAAGDSGSSPLNQLANATNDVLDSASFLDIASQPGHLRAALPAASEKARNAMATLDEMEPGYEGLVGILRDTATQVDAIAEILADLPTRELPNVGSVERALVAPAEELNGLTSRWLGIGEWQKTRNGGGDHEQALRHLIEAAGGAVGMAMSCTRQLIRDAVYFVT